MSESRRVHVVPVRTAVDRVVVPATRVGADLVYLLTDDRHDSAAVAAVTSRLEDADVAVQRVPADHGDADEMTALVTTVARGHAGDDVLVGVPTDARPATVEAVTNVLDAEPAVTTYPLRARDVDVDPHATRSSESEGLAAAADPSSRR
jgi:hypothetical protein